MTFLLLLEVASLDFESALLRPRPSFLLYFKLKSILNVLLKDKDNSDFLLLPPKPIYDVKFSLLPEVEPAVRPSMALDPDPDLEPDYGL